MTERQKKESKNKRQQTAKNKKAQETSRLIQNKFTSTRRRLTKHEKKRLLAEEENKKRFELREAKVNLLKKWRKEPEEQTRTTKTNHKSGWKSLKKP